MTKTKPSRNDIINANSYSLSEMTALLFGWEYIQEYEEFRGSSQNRPAKWKKSDGKEIDYYDFRVTENLEDLLLLKNFILKTNTGNMFFVSNLISIVKKSDIVIDYVNIWNATPTQIVKALLITGYHGDATDKNH